MTQTSARVDTSNEAPTLAHLAGPAAILAGLLITGSQLALLPMIRQVTTAALTSTVYITAMTAYVIGFWTLMIALVGAYLRQAHQAGRFGLIALCVAVIGTTDMAGNMWFDGFAGPWLADVIPGVLDAPRNGTLVAGAVSSYALMALGWTLFGLASFRARVFPRTLSAALTVAGLLAYRPVPPSSIALGLAIGALGVWLVRDGARR